jgi:DNA-directed RNA polymerase specialized sigma subunit
MTLSEIGVELGISRMCVSRLLSWTLIRLRMGLSVEVIVSSTVVTPPSC